MLPRYAFVLSDPFAITDAAGNPLADCIATAESARAIGARLDVYDAANVCEKMEVLAHLYSELYSEIKF